jgi:hypothetical protein
LLRIPNDPWAVKTCPCVNRFECILEQVPIIPCRNWPICPWQTLLQETAKLTKSNYLFIYTILS